MLVLNKTAQAAVEKYRGINKKWVFVHTSGQYKNQQVKQVRSESWVKAWKKAGLPNDKHIKKGVHNLKHTFGRRLSAVGCPWHERKVLLGHKIGDITDLYSPAQIEQLLKWVNKVDESKVEMSMVRPIRAVNQKV